MLELILPKTGIYEGDVTLIEWLVAEGGEVAIGDPLFLMESEKIEMEIESDTDGWLHREAEAGLEAPIGTRIGAIAETPDE
ncbi:MAG: dihydrolipoamide acyltransferase, partial [Acidimicrobiia bacterium]|nr:dihydrolipoamide acyltransferase [Acidimicrobiia bacterium]